MENYYAAIGGEQRGPFPVGQLAAQGVRPDTLIWSAHMTNWVPASEVPEVAAALAYAWGVGSPAVPGPVVPGPAMGGGAPWQPPGAATDPTRAQVSSNKVAAGICGIFLVGFGIHKFILGMTTPGLIMLLSTVLTCGVGYIVMHVIGLIEGIIYLTKTDEEFYQTYVVQKKGWF